MPCPRKLRRQATGASSCSGVAPPCPEESARTPLATLVSKPIPTGNPDIDAMNHELRRNFQDIIDSCVRDYSHIPLLHEALSQRIDMCKQRLDGDPWAHSASAFLDTSQPSLTCQSMLVSDSGTRNLEHKAMVRAAWPLTSDTSCVFVWSPGAHGTRHRGTSCFYRLVAMFSLVPLGFGCRHPGSVSGHLSPEPPWQSIEC